MQAPEPVEGPGYENVPTPSRGISFPHDILPNTNKQRMKTQKKTPTNRRPSWGGMLWMPLGLMLIFSACHKIKFDEIDGNPLEDLEILKDPALILARGKVIQKIPD